MLKFLLIYKSKSVELYVDFGCGEIRLIKTSLIYFLVSCETYLGFPKLFFKPKNPAVIEPSLRRLLAPNEDEIKWESSGFPEKNGPQFLLLGMIAPDKF